MNAENQIEEMTLTEVDMLANDLNQHCADLAENYCGGTTCLSCLAHALTEKGYRKSSDIAREIFERLHAHLKFDGHTISVWKNDLMCIAKEYGVDLEKYTEEGK